MGMLRDDLDVTSSYVCLLQSLFRGQAFVLAEANAGITKEGSYIFVDSQDASFVRTRKAAKTTIGERCKEHAKGSKKGSSKFYLSYPRMPAKFPQKVLACIIGMSREASTSLSIVILPTSHGKCSLKSPPNFGNGTLSNRISRTSSKFAHSSPYGGESGRFAQMNG
jgi:hypothetical protein